MNTETKLDLVVFEPCHMDMVPEEDLIGGSDIRGWLVKEHLAGWTLLNDNHAPEAFFGFIENYCGTEVWCVMTRGMDLRRFCRIVKSVLYPFVQSEGCVYAHVQEWGIRFVEWLGFEFLEHVDLPEGSCKLYRLEAGSCR